MLEQLHSPLVVVSSDAHEELKSMTPGLLTRHHIHHYLGFARNQQRLFEKEEPKRVKPLLYIYRVLLTGIHLMKANEIQADLRVLIADQPREGVEELIALKVGGAEREPLPPQLAEWHARRIDALEAELVAAGETTALPELPTARAALSDLLVRVRLAR